MGLWQRPRPAVDVQALLMKSMGDLFNQSHYHLSNNVLQINGLNTTNFPKKIHGVKES